MLAVHSNVFIPIFVFTVETRPTMKIFTPSCSVEHFSQVGLQLLDCEWHVVESPWLKWVLRWRVIR